MKKVIFLLFATTFVVVSFLSIKQFEYIQFQSFSKDSIEEKWNIIIDAGNFEKSKSENFIELQKIALNADVNLQRISYEKDKNNRDKMVYYVVISEPEIYYNNISLKSGFFLDKNSGINEYLSTEKTNDKYQIGQLEIFHSFDPIEIRPMIASEKTRDIKGTYTTIGSENAEKFKAIAEENGFTLSIAKSESESSMVNYPYEDMMYSALIVLFLLIALAVNYDVVNNYKSIAIRNMLGYYFWEIGIYILKRYYKIFIVSIVFNFFGLLMYLYFYNGLQQLIPFLSFWKGNTIMVIGFILLIFIITWIGTKSINTVHMIKNKKPIKLLFILNIFVRFIIAIFLIIGMQKAVGNFFELKSTVDQEEKWSLLKDYSVLGIINVNEFMSSMNEVQVRDNIRKLYKELETQGAIYVSPSSYYFDNSADLLQDTNNWEGKKVEINGNYLSINTIMDTRNKRVVISEPSYNEIKVLVPIKYKEYEDNIKNKISNDYTGIYNYKQKNPVSVSIQYVKNGQSYFTFNPNVSESQNNEITDPIAVIINHSFDSSLLANIISRGSDFYTKNSGNGEPFEGIQQILKRNKLEDIWQPITVAYASVELKVAKNKEVFQLATMYSILYLILLGILLFYSAMFYLELNQQLLAIQWVFGYSFFEKHSLLYLAIIVFWNSVFMFSTYILTNNSYLMSMNLIILLFDLILISIILTIKEISVAKRILIEK